MRILFIHPVFPETFWSFKHALKFINKKAAYPPLGLLTVAAMLPAEWSKRLIDLNIQSLTEDDLAWADYAFISAMAVQKASAVKTIARCKKAGLPVIAGGPLFTTEFAEFEGVDHFVLNEAELTLPFFLSDLKRGSAHNIYNTSDFADIRKTPIPLWELSNLKKYGAMSVQFSRGCPFNCDFCNVTALFGHKPRIKSTAQMISELDKLYTLGWRGQVFFVDDNFISKKKHLKTNLLPALIEWRKDKKGMPFNTEASVDLVDDEVLMKMMVEAGFDTVFIGIETPDNRSLAECNKKQNKNRDLVASVKLIQRAGIQVQGGFIVGFDNDTVSIFKRQIDFIQKSGIATAMVGLLQAPTGTKLYNRLKKENRLIGPMSGNNDDTTNIIPRMDLDLLREGYRHIIAYIYSPKNYYRRLKTFLKEYKAPKIKAPFEFQHIVAFLYSCLRLGIIGKERYQYWKILFWTFFRRPKLFSLTITLSIYGYHFPKISQL